MKLELLILGILSLLHLLDNQAMVGQKSMDDIVRRSIHLNHLTMNTYLDQAHENAYTGSYNTNQFGKRSYRDTLCQIKYRKSVPTNG